MPVLHHPYNTAVLPGAQKEPRFLQFVPIASCPRTGNYWKEFESIHFTSALQVLVDVDKTPGVLLLQAEF